MNTPTAQFELVVIIIVIAPYPSCWPSTEWIRLVTHHLLWMNAMTPCHRKPPMNRLCFLILVLSLISFKCHGLHYNAWRICVVDIGWELQQWLFNEMCFWGILMINWHLHNDIHLTFALIISHPPLKLKAILLTKQSVYNCVDFLFFFKRC